jgi:hypothetical protein
VDEVIQIQSILQISADLEPSATQRRKLRISTDSEAVRDACIEEETKTDEFYAINDNQI